MVLDSWWEISLATLVIRSTTTLPLSIYSMRHQARLLQIYPLLQMVKHQFIADKQQTAIRMRAIMQTHRIKPVSAFLVPLAQIPVFLGFSQFIRHQCGYALFSSQPTIEPLAALSNGGFGVWENLLLSDPTLFSPLILSSIHLMNLSVNEMSASRTAKSSVIRMIMIGLALLSAPISAQVPMALNVYWLSSGAFSLAQNLAFRHPKVRRRLGFPALGAQSQLEKYSL